MTFSWVFYFISWTVWIVLVIILLYGAIKKDWKLVKRSAKYAINSIALFVGWSFYLELAVIVRSPILITKEASLESLREWIWNYQFKDILISLLTIIILLGINLVFYYKFENKKNKLDIILLPILVTIILAICIWYTGQDTLVGFIQERNRH